MLGAVGPTVVVLGASDVQRCGLRDSILREAGSAVGRLGCAATGHLYLLQKMIATLCRSSISGESFKTEE